MPSKYDKEYYKKNKKKHLEWSKVYYLKNKEKLKKYARDYYKKHAVERREETNKKSRVNYIRDRDRKLEWQKQHHKKKRIEVLELLGGAICKICGFSDWRALHIDHVNGDGNEERRKYGWSNMKKQRQMILSSKSKYQVLCANCNFIKRYENKESKKRSIKD